MEDLKTFYKDISVYISNHYGFSMAHNKVFKKIDNGIELFFSLKETDEIIIGFQYSSNNIDLLNKLLSDKCFEKYFSDLVVDEYNNIIYRKYLAINYVNISESIYLFNCLNRLEIMYNKYNRKNGI